MLSTQPYGCGGGDTGGGDAKGQHVHFTDDGLRFESHMSEATWTLTEATVISSSENSGVERRRPQPVSPTPPEFFGLSA